MHCCYCIENYYSAPLYNRRKGFCVINFLYLSASIDLNDPSGRRLRLYVHISTTYLVFGGSFYLRIYSNVSISCSPSISGYCASTNLSASTCSFIYACVNMSGFCMCMV
jgi:hypothetical protein